MLFRKKHEFRPDKTHSGSLSKLSFTKKQRLAIAKWLLMAFVMVILSVLQDVILSKLRLFGTTTDLVPCAIIMVCVMHAPDAGSIFALVSASLYWFSGSASGPYVIAILTVLGVAASVFRCSFLHKRFGSTWLCTAVSVMVYELVLFTVGLLLGHTTLSRLTDFVITGALSVAVAPLLYPIFFAIRKIGGESWKE